MKERLSILKKHENDCYRMCFYLLQSEKMACEAAKDALYKLIEGDSFFAADSQTKNDLLRKESMKSALQIKKKLM
jgi:DNA-directed RNA polymerase specialized sigma24 family protein